MRQRSTTPCVSKEKRNATPVKRIATVCAARQTGMVGVFVLWASLSPWLHANPPDDTWFARNIQPHQRQDIPITAAASCAATACHGGPRAGVSSEGAVRGSEYPLWRESDPHERSWRTLCGDKSVAMLKRLQVLKDGQIVDRVAFDNCLACHNSSRHFEEPRTFERLTEGVGCSSCHGPDQLWRAAHVQPEWSAGKALADGFSQTKNLLARARVCAGCHVGDRDRDMNHDIIAAGHPALHYEFGTYQRRLPKHWRSGATPHEDDEAYTWLAGQLAALDAFLCLLESRVSNKTETSQWPELAVYDCTSCHQKLSEETYQSASRSRPALEPSQWYFFGVKQLLQHRSGQHVSSESERELNQALHELEQTLRSSHAKPKAILAASQKTRHALDCCMMSLLGSDGHQPFDKKALVELVSASGIDRAGSASWESAAQYYLASVSAKAEWPQAPHSDSVLESAKRLRMALQFRADTSTPENRFGVDADRSLGNQSLKAHWEALQKSPPPAQPGEVADEAVRPSLREGAERR